ncbi:MAG TPA: filamentous hemagglutinin N-terminal domain-containing protein [Phenylobacterium sp.]|nr:filamentous hemagglutinin N-terminal domain-containing protein [Phenylobacterium sp.]
MSQIRPASAALEPRPGRGRRWLGGGALGGVLSLTLGLAGAAAYPSNSDPGVQVSPGGAGPSISTPPASGTGAMDIVLGAPRTILTWQDFNVAAGETVNFRFDQRSWIVLNRLTGGQMTIDGQVNGLVGGGAGGNVWFSAPNGVVFGPNARVNVGGLLATTSQLLDDESFLDPRQSTIDFRAPSGSFGGVTVQGGARLEGSGGTLALVAAQVNTAAGSQIGGAADVFYGSAANFSVDFLPTGDNDLALLNFLVPAGGGSASPTPLNLAGETLARNVTIAHVSRADVLNAVISAPGLIVAQSASGRDGNVILSSGIDIGGGVTASPSPGGRAALTADFGEVIATGGIRIHMRGAASQTSFFADYLAAGAAVESRTGQFTMQAGPDQTLSAGTYVYIDAPNGITTQAVGAVQDASFYATSDGEWESPGTGVINLGAVSAGGGIYASGQRVISPSLASGGAVGARTSGASAGAPAIQLGEVLAATEVNLLAGNGSIQLERVTLTGVGAAGAPFFSANATAADADVIFGSAAPGALIGPPGYAASIVAGRDVRVNLGGAASFNTLQAGRDLRLTAADLTLGSALTARSAQIESATGALILGGPAGASPANTMVIDNAEFQRIRVSDQASFYAGPTSVAAPRGDLTVRDLAVDPGRVPRLNLYAGTGNDVRVTGVLTPTASGGELRIGMDDAVSAWRPRRILVSGSIGAASGSPQAGFTGVRAFGSVRLNAANDVIIGSQRFIDLIIPTPASQIDIARGLPTGAAATGEEVGRVFLAAGVLSLSAGDRIVQQNTAAAGEENGLYLANALSGARGDTVLTLGGTPLVDLFGGFVDQAGVLQTGFRAALAPELRRPSGAAFSRSVRFNGCSIGGGGGCGITGGPEFGFRLEDFVRPDQITDQPLLTSAPEAEDEDETDPVVTGAGNEEIWRSRK